MAWGKHAASQQDYRLTTQERKRILLAHIHGVDIDSQAVEVAKLNLLLKASEGGSAHAQGQLTYDKNERLLPDLEKNIVCGNSLVEWDITKMMKLTREDEERIKPFSFSQAFPDIMKAGGFDAVIGNPPYGALFSEEVATYLAKRFNTFVGRGESYLVFVESCLSLMQLDGLFGYIVPDTYLNLGFTSALRSHILANSEIQSIVVLPSRVFADANVDTTLLLLKRKSKIDHFYDASVHVKLFDKKSIITHLEAPNRVLQFKIADWVSEGFFNVESSADELKLIQRLDKQFKSISEYCEMFSGIKSYEVGKGTPPQTPAIREKKPFTSEKRQSKDWYPMFDGKHIGRYVNYWDKNNWIKYGPWLAAPRNPEHFEGDKILIRKIVGKTLIAMKATGRNYCNTLLFILKVKPEQKLDANHVLGILNSKFISWYFKKKLMISVADEFPQIMIRDILTFPLPLPSAKIRLSQEVDEIMKVEAELAVAQGASKDRLAKKRDYIDSQIDRLVYELYGLSEEEIRIVEGSH